MAAHGVGRYAASVFATVLGPYPRPTDPEATEDDVLQLVLRDQLDAGLGMVADGQVRSIMSGRASSSLGEIVDAWRRADATIRDLTTELEPGIQPPLVKACVIGPYSAVRGGSKATAAERARATFRAAESVHSLVEALFEAGAPVVQIAEDELTHVAATDHDEIALAAGALRRATQDLSGHISLSVAGGNADACGAALFFDLSVASYAFDLIHGPDNWRLITQAPRDRGIVCGVADARTAGPDAEAVLIWAARYAASSNGRGLERVGLAPSAGLEHLPREAARAKLEALAEAARKAGLPAAELAKQIDPRAIDARSGALGKYDPDAAARTGRRVPGKARRPGASGTAGG